MYVIPLWINNKLAKEKSGNPIYKDMKNRTSGDHFIKLVKDQYTPKNCNILLLEEIKDADLKLYFVFIDQNN